MACHYTYDGEERTLIARPVTSPYAVESIPVGSYFQFKVVYQYHPASEAGVKVYTYADREPAMVLLHQASFPVTARSHASTGLSRHTTPYGFTGHQWVYEPVRDGELQYWCEWKWNP